MPTPSIWNRFDSRRERPIFNDMDKITEFLAAFSDSGPEPEAKCVYSKEELAHIRAATRRMIPRNEAEWQRAAHASQEGLRRENKRLAKAGIKTGPVHA
jgi:hypothetical protein